MPGKKLKPPFTQFSKLIDFKLLFLALLLFACSFLFYGWSDGMYIFIQVGGAISTVAFGAMLIGCLLKKIRRNDSLLVGSGMLSVAAVGLLFTVYADQSILLFYITLATMAVVVGITLLLYRWL